MKAQFKTTHVLGLVSIVELMVSDGMWYSVLLWVGYGVFVIIRDDRD
jgi:hypothetical protein